MLSKPIEVRILRQRSSQVDILRLKDKVGAIGVEQNFIGIGARDRK